MSYKSEKAHFFLFLFGCRCGFPPAYIMGMPLEGRLVGALRDEKTAPALAFILADSIWFGGHSKLLVVTSNN